MKYANCNCLLGGDFNTYLNTTYRMSNFVNKFLIENNLTRCDLLYPCDVCYTYANEALNQFSKIDYITCDNVNVSRFEIIENSTNLSDHLPVLVECQCIIESSGVSSAQCDKQSVVRLRWDHADIVGYYNSTMVQLQSILTEMQSFEANCDNNYGTPNDTCQFIEYIYEKIVSALNFSAVNFVPTHKVNFYKFWWS